MVTFKITEVHGEGQYEEFHFCEECAQKYISEVSAKKKQIVDPVNATDKHCDSCGIKFIDFRNSGRLGCPGDYEVFKAELLPLLETIHGSTRHAGKTPRCRHSQQIKHLELSQLQKDLKKAIEAENYEEAAQLRDRIREIETI